MIEFTLGVFAGIFLLPWYILAIIVGVILIDVGYSSHDDFVEATWALFLGLALVSGLGWWTGGFNPALWIWSNPTTVITGFVGYALAGCVWCFAKWWLFLKTSHKESEVDFAKTMKSWENNEVHHPTHTQGIRDPQLPKPSRQRPDDSFAKNNKSRLMGWIFHWPFSMLAFVVGDVIVRFAETLQEALQGVFERMASSRFEGYED